MGEAIAGIIDPGGAILLGRTTYEMFAPAWSVRTAEEDPGAPFFNNTHKYVVSSTLKSAARRPANPRRGGVLNHVQAPRHAGKAPHFRNAHGVHRIN
jgi:dihydrofolate reductase